VLSIDPAIPRAWPSYEAVLRHGAAQYTITVENPRGATRGVAQAELDGAPVPLSSGGAAEFALVEEGVHRIRVVLGE
jgi:cyclic beta-1,2-glucan glucanotransferase